MFWNIFKKKEKPFNYEGDTRSKLVLAFEDGDTKYYRYPTELSLPFSRFIEVMGLLERLSSGLSGAEMEKVLVVMEDALSKGLKTPKNAVTVAGCIHALREMQSNVIHKDLLLNIAAICVIRGDESATGVVNPKIHQQKIEVFERLAEKEGEHGFFISLSIERLNPLLNMSAKDFKELWNSNSVRLSTLSKKIQLLTSR